MAAAALQLRARRRRVPGASHRVPRGDGLGGRHSTNAAQLGSTSRQAQTAGQRSQGKRARQGVGAAGCVCACYFIARALAIRARGPASRGARRRGGARGSPIGLSLSLASSWARGRQISAPFFMSGLLLAALTGSLAVADTMPSVALTCVALRALEKSSRVAETRARPAHCIPPSLADCRHSASTLRS